MYDTEEALAVLLTPGLLECERRPARQLITSVLARGGHERKAMARTLKKYLDAEQTDRFLHPDPPDDYEDD